MANFSPIWSHCLPLLDLVKKGDKADRFDLTERKFGTIDLIWMVGKNKKKRSNR